MKKSTYISFVSFAVILCLALFYLLYSIHERESKNKLIIENYISKKVEEAQSNFEIIKVKEIESCLLSLRLEHDYNNTLFINNSDYIDQSCINYKMQWSLTHDASRFDFLSILFESNGVSFDLKKSKKPNFESIDI